LGCDCSIMEMALVRWNARAVEALSAKVCVAHEVGEIGSCWWAVNVLRFLLALPRMFVGINRASPMAYWVAK
jgi:hypothetical protein